MKKAIPIILVLPFLILSACSVPEDEVLNSLGEYESKVYFTSGGFQDYTDYAKYTFDDVDFSKNKYFTKISVGSKEELITHIENFEEWIESLKSSVPDNEVVTGYDFEPSVISQADYLYIYDDPDYPELGSYTVYFFDMESMTLYYFHNNI